MLSDIILGLIRSALVCVEDSREQSGHDLMIAFIQNAVLNGKGEVHVFCYENPISRMKVILRCTEESNIHFHDRFSDPCGWLQGLKENGSAWKVIPEPETEKTIVVIDSLSPLVLEAGFAYCYRQLHKLLRCKNVAQILCMAHEDLLPDAHMILPQLQHLATTSIRVEPPSRNSFGNPVAVTSSRKPGGRVLNEVEFYCIQHKDKLTSHKVEAVAEKQDEVVPVDENSLTTFKLSLGSQEKQARSDLVLPYVKTSKDKGGKVFYQPDEADDWDEEDPDDDLDV